MTVLEIQKALIALGYDPGVPDGVWGPMSKAATKAFQKDNGLSADGIVGPKTLAALKPELREIGAHMLTIDVLRKVCPSARDDIVEGIIERRSAIDAAGIVTKPRHGTFPGADCDRDGWAEGARGEPLLHRAAPDEGLALPLQDAGFRRSPTPTTRRSLPTMSMAVGSATTVSMTAGCSAVAV